MVIKVLPDDVRRMLCASAQINNYKTAIEELVYNSLDAGSTSIAIRVNIQDNRIQVVDNGYGIRHNDFDVLGQRYMTSKLTDLSTLKSLPNYYGYRGEFLTNVIEIAQNVKFVSRYKSGEETWVQSFYEGKKKQLEKIATRPSKGTTVEIKGFLYNLSIQKRGIDPINELQNIKSFLEQLSVIHNNISLSLRDDSKNSIIFQIHKKRDLCQTLSTLFNIKNEQMQEFQVEKNQFKVMAIIGKTDIEIGRHWIYLNRRFIQNSSQLHKILNEHFKKYLLIKDTKKLKSKINHDENHLFKHNIPFYFLFITCPYIEYDLSTIRRQSVVEFKSWVLIRNLLEKLVKFYIGDIKLKEYNKTENIIEVQQGNDAVVDKTRDQIKKIINKILGSNSKRLEVCQLQNGIKGKLIKRKRGKKTKEVNKLTNEKCNVQKLSNITKPDIVVEQKVTPLKQNHDIEEKSEMHEIEPTFKIKRKKKKTNEVSMTMAVKNITNQKSKIKARKPSKLRQNNKAVNTFRRVKDTDTIPKNTKNVRQKAEDFLKHQINYIIESVDADKHMNKMNMLKHNKNRNYFLRNKIYNDVMSKIKNNPFKTTYDLLQTISESQTAIKTQSNKLFPEERFPYYHSNEYKHNKTRKNVKTPTEPRFPESVVLSEFTNTDCRIQQELKYNTISRKFTSRKLSPDYSDCDIDCKYKETFNYSLPVTLDYSLPVRSQSLRCEDIFKENSDILCNQNKINYLSNILPASLLTYESHKYRHNIPSIMKNKSIVKSTYANKAQYIRYITTESKDNFRSKNDNSKFLFKNNYKQRNLKRTSNLTKFYGEHKAVSYIEFNKTKDIISPVYQSGLEVCRVKANKQNIHDCEPTSGFGNTYPMPSYDVLSQSNTTYGTLNSLKRTYCKEVPVTNSILCTGSGKNYSAEHHINTNDQSHHDEFIRNIQFISNLQDPEVHIGNIEPMNVCEAILGTEDCAIEKEFAISFNRNNILDDSLYNYGNHYLNDISERYTTQIIERQQNGEDISHHFSNSLITNYRNTVNSKKVIMQELAVIQSNERNAHNENTEHYKLSDNGNNFYLKDRLRFLPKGMSQIFEKCGSKTMCDYNLEKEYYEKVIYDVFAQDVQMHTEVYQPEIQNVEDLTTKDIHKFKNKVQKDNTSLVFDEMSLKEAKILNQVDCKFIAAILKEKYNDSENQTEYLIFFDQHAVHERVRLEQNLAEYITGAKWKSAPLDNITLKMSEDEILYLHNYKDKFNQLGLQWTMIKDNEVSVSSIPEAILGKNPREVDKVMKAVKNLVIEEINIIKLQKGCISLYPKSIMNLVFSEACRYAIKFGDKLSRNVCIDLVKELSDCKTPFQCAHGRPVMAVLLDIKSNVHEYKISTESLRQFKINSKMI